MPAFQPNGLECDGGADGAGVVVDVRDDGEESCANRLDKDAREGSGRRGEKQGERVKLRLLVLSYKRA